MGNAKKGITERTKMISNDLPDRTSPQTLAPQNKCGEQQARIQKKLKNSKKIRKDEFLSQIEYGTSLVTISDACSMSEGESALKAAN